MSSSAAGQPTSQQRTFLGHPLGLYVLFFTEMWERFSYYGMRALLVLYMLDHFKYTQRQASSVYKWYTSLVYLTPLLGGFLADRYLGNKWAVIIGATLMAIGQFLLTFEPEPIFYMALVFMILGNGFFKPNMSTQVGRLYPQNDPRRDGAYTIFYMGINLGAFLSPLVCGWLALNTLGGRHTGFMAAGIGMLLGLLVYLAGLRWVIELKPEEAAAGTTAAGGQPVAGREAISEEKAEQVPSTVPTLNRVSPGLLRLIGYALLIGAIALGAVRIASHLLTTKQAAAPEFLNKAALSEYVANDTLVSLGIVAVCALISAWILGHPRGALRDRVLTIYVLGVFVVFFWAAFEQAGNALNVWADKATNRYLTRPAEAPPLYPEKPAATPKDKGQEGQETTATLNGGLSRWVTMWRLKPSKVEDPTKKSKAGSGLWAWFTDLWNPVATEWFQSINALAIFLLAPVFAWLWTYLDRRGLNPSVPLKMAIGLLLISLAFGLMIVAAERENGPTDVSFNGSLPSQIKLSPSNQLSGEEDHALKPYQAGRLTYDKDAHMLHMTGVLADTERDRIVRDTAPESFVKSVKELQTKSQDAAGDRFSVSVTLNPVPPGFDMKYVPLDPGKLRYEKEDHTLTATDYRLADKDLKALLVAAGEPTFRDAMNALYQESARHRVSSWWLFWFYIIATLAELCLSPVGLSMVSKLAPAKFATMLMGLWLLTSFFGNFAAGAFGERWGEWTPTEYFLYIMALLGAAALVLFLLVRKIGTMMHGVK
jgi:dipeptide/tripeptide permease